MAEAELAELSPKFAPFFGMSLIPVVMAGIIAVYSLVIAVLIAGDLEPPPGQNYSLFKLIVALILNTSTD
ncbi:hypothetical protein P7C71_g2367, partial [Lecanoromycetidae sp. Uapishka_2]